MASPTQWTRVWASSRSWWQTGKAGVLQSPGLQRVGHHWVTELTDWLGVRTSRENHLRCIIFFVERFLTVDLIPLIVVGLITFSISSGIYFYIKFKICPYDVSFQIYWFNIIHEIYLLCVAAEVTYVWSEVKFAQLCLTLCDPMDYTVYGILQARILEWIAFPFSSGSSLPRNQSGVSCLAGDSLTTELSSICL